MATKRKTESNAPFTPPCFTSIGKRRKPSYDSEKMVEDHYAPYRNGGMMSWERPEIISLAVAHKLKKTGLNALADYMNVHAEKARGVPSGINKVAEKHSTVKPKRNNGGDRKIYVHSFKETEKEVLGPSY